MKVTLHASNSDDNGNEGIENFGDGEIVGASTDAGYTEKGLLVVYSEHFNAFLDFYEESEEGRHHGKGNHGFWITKS